MSATGGTVAMGPLARKRRPALLRHIVRDKYLILLVLPVVAYFVLFSYLPMYGVIIAFKDYSISRGILGSPWAGLKYFEQFFNSFYFWRLLRNTLLLSVYSLLWGFPIPILFALILNEFGGFFKRFVQTVSYLPHFVSVVVICGMIVNVLSPQGGLVNQLIAALGGQSVNFLGDPKYFRTIFVASEVWQSFGWNSIIYLAALTSIDQELYEAATIDGAGRLRQLWHITLPGIKETIVIILIMSVGGLMGIGFEKIILLYNGATYETADVIGTYVYRAGLLGTQYSFAAAVGLFNSVVSIILLVSCNAISRRVGDVGIW
jgi:putative aldouronate transport system permease protein